MEANPDCLTVRYVTDTTIAELDAALAATVPGVPRLKEATAVSGMVAVFKTTIAPLALVKPLLGSPLLTPINDWNIIYASEASLGLERRVTPFLHWIWD